MNHPAGCAPSSVRVGVHRDKCEWTLGLAEGFAARAGPVSGLLAIADIRYTRAYSSELEACGLKITDRRSLGARFWYGAGPWAATRLVAAIKP
jgi:hypothetical protein